MVYDFVIVCGAVGLAVTCLAIFVAAGLGMVVWLAGSDWARRPSAGSHLTLHGRR